MALKLVQALCARTDRSNLLPAFVKMAAIGTLADVVPLVGENRIIAKVGLGLLSRGPHRVGLRALLDVCGLTGRDIDSYHIGFVMAPRINAAGRMSSSDIAARLLLATDESMADEARALAETLDQREHPAPAGRGGDRRPGDARSSRPTSTSGRGRCIVVAGEGWHRGVIGIVASKLVDAFHRPAIVLSLDGDVAHGSCRSIPSFDLLAGLEASADVLMTFGGHKQAAGVTLEAGRVREFRARINAHADALPGAGRPAAAAVDRRAAAVQATSPARSRPSWRTWRRSAPGTPRRCSRTSGVEVIDGPRRIKERHLKMALKQDGKVMRGMAWRAADREDLVVEHKARAGSGLLARAGDLERRSVSSSCPLRTFERPKQPELASGFWLPASGRAQACRPCSSCYPELR